MRTLCVTLLVSFFLLNGCANFGLQSRNEYTVTESISTSFYKVAFCGNAYMRQPEAEKLAIQRACELTLKKGYTHFVILEKSDQSEMCMLSDAPRGTYADAPAKVTSGSFASTQSLTRPNMTLKIQCYAQKDAPKDSIDAQQYLDENFPGLKFK